MSSDLTTTDDLRWMVEALHEAAQAAAENEVPIGAVVVQNDRCLGRGHNSPISCDDPTAHAEIQALRNAARCVGNYRLIDATLYVTVEPCLMCMGAIILARIKRLVFGARDPKAGAVFSVYEIGNDRRLNHTVEVTEGICMEECSNLLKDFFKTLRK